MFEKIATSAWQVFAVSLVLGAGLPALFAMGVRSLAYGQGGDAEVSHEAPHPIGKALAFFFFALVALAIALGITVVVASGFGKAVSFQHIYPTIVSK